MDVVARRMRLRRWVGMPILLGFAASMVFAATPQQYVPHRLLKAVRATRAALRTVGLYPGHAVFEGTDSSNENPIAYCIWIEGHALGQPNVDLFRPDVPCPIEGIRWRIEPLHRAVHRALATAISSQPSARAERLLERIERTFCGVEQNGLPMHEIALAWWLRTRHYYTLEEKNTPLLYLRYDCDEGRTLERNWFPSTETLTARWGRAPWPRP